MMLPITLIVSFSIVDRPDRPSILVAFVDFICLLLHELHSVRSRSQIYVSTLYEPMSVRVSQPTSVCCNHTIIQLYNIRKLQYIRILGENVGSDK